MKKIAAIILGILVLAAGLLGCASCKPEESDPLREVYGTYKYVGSIDIDKNSQPTELDYFWAPEELKDFIDGVIDEAGDTITLTKEAVKFSGGTVELEVLYFRNYRDFITFDSKVGDEYFQFDCLWIASIIRGGLPSIYWLETRRSFEFNGDDYYVTFFYEKQ